MLQIFTVKDNIAKEFGQLFCLKNDDLAIEEITTLFRNGVKCGYTDNPSRYALYRLGSYENENGLIHGCVKPQLVKSLISIKDDFMKLRMSDEYLYKAPDSTSCESDDDDEELFIDPRPYVESKEEV